MSATEQRTSNAWSRYADLDLTEDTTIHELVEFAAEICGTPFAGISLTDDQHLRFLAKIGFSEDRIDLQQSLCAHTLEEGRPLIVPDLDADDRFRAKPVTIDGKRMRFYVGFPLINSEQTAIGTVCVLGENAHEPGSADLRTLKLIASQVFTHIELRRQLADDDRALHHHRTTEAALRAAERKFRDIFEHATDGIFQTTPEGRFIAANGMLAKIYGFDSAADLLAHFEDIASQLYVEAGRREEFQKRMVGSNLLSNFESRIRRRDGEIRWISENARAVRSPDGEILYYEGTVEDITDRVASEMAMRDSELRFRSVWEKSLDGMRLTDGDGFIRAVNPAYCRIVGMEKEALIGHPYTVIYHDQADTEQRLANFQSDFRERTIPATVEQHFEFHNGRACDLELANSFIEFEQSSPLLLSVFHDITDRKLAELRVRESEHLYHSLVDYLPQNIFRKDVNGRFTFVNDGFCREIAKAREEIIGRTDFDLFPRALADKYKKDDEQLIKNGKPYESVEAHYVPQLGKIYVQVIKSPLYDIHGNPTGIQGIFWDVTERKRIEEQLAFERELLRALLDNVPDRIYFKDTESRFLQVSLAMAHRLGLKNPEEAVGKRDADFHPPAQAREFFEDEQRILMTGSPIVNKVERQIGPDGGTIWASVTKVPTRNRSGFINGIIGISRDITDIKLAEEAVAAARDSALESTRLKSQFLAAMSHEIRTPMNGIIGMTDLLLDTELSLTQREFAGTISNSAHSLLHIINDILDFSKIEAGKMSLESVPFDLIEVVEDSIELLAPRAQFKNLDAVYHVDRDVPRWLVGDSVRLRQILVNLLGNAVKFTEVGQVMIRVTTLECDQDKALIRFEVSDTGIGIEPDVQSRIFEAFTQADGTMTRRYGGTGLGLSISRQLVELMQGHMDIRSEVGKGSEFFFDLPFTRTSPPEQHTTADPDLTDTRVLVAVKNRHRSVALSEILSRWGVHAETAHAGSSVIERIKAAGAAGEPLDIVLIDLKLDDTDGLSLAEHILHDPDLPEVKLVLLTPLGQRLDAEILRLAGFSAALLKPVRRDRLRDCLNRLLFSPSDSSFELALDTQLIRQSHAEETPPPPLNILLVEDNTVNQQVALLQLRKIGHTPDLVTDGSQAVEAYREGNYQLVLMDCQMPVMDGYTATRLIREFEIENERARVPIYAMTADASGDHEAASAAAGMDGSITKPVHLPDLRSVVQMVANRQMLKSDTAILQKTAVEKPSPDAVLDLSVIDNLRDLGLDEDDDPAAELAGLFLEDAPRRIEGMRAGIEGRDMENARVAAHSLKGSARNLGARALGNLSHEVEELIVAGSWETAREKLSTVERALETLKDRLREEKLIAS
ncbi:MAG: PAS domain S-box protein [Verrucomicrobiae bacterium]|nr:PAS domain S-box protein [Verrucomicrobiae bacterium]